MKPIVYIDRLSGEEKKEKVYGGKVLAFLYQHPWGGLFAKFFAKNAFCSVFYGFLQKITFSKRKVAPFIKEFDVDSSEFLDSPESFCCFNDFFIRKLKPSCRPIAKGEDVAVIPADGRYYFFQNIQASDGFIVKGEKFTLKDLLQDEELAARYEKGAMVMGRLCPTDYHRFHFPCTGVPGPSKLINGFLYSVNPIALKQNIDIFTQNKRTVCKMKTDRFGQVLLLEIGATSVGTIVETYAPGKPYQKGDEKGYFSFGGSSLLVLFEPGKIILDEDLLKLSKRGFEIRCLMGQSLGRAASAQ